MIWLKSNFVYFNLLINFWLNIFFSISNINIKFRIKELIQTYEKQINICFYFIFINNKYSIIFVQIIGFKKFWFKITYSNCYILYSYITIHIIRLTCLYFFNFNLFFLFRFSMKFYTTYLLQLVICPIC